ncbi:MAG: hypothetical protein ACU0CO_15450 [Shimia sp.]
MLEFEVSVHWTSLMGIASGVISFASYLPYVRDMVWGSTRPQQTSWFIWSLLSSISLLALIVDGATTSLPFVASQCGITCAILLFSLQRGERTRMTRLDHGVLAIAALGIALWWVTDEPAYALLLSVGVSFAAGTCTVVKAYEAPKTETLSTWLLTCLGAVCAMAAVTQPGWTMFVYPAYLLLLGAAISTALLLGRRRDAARDVRRPLVPMGNGGRVLIARPMPGPNRFAQVLLPRMG